MSQKKKTHEEFVKEIYDLVGDEYTVLGEYVSSDTKILMRHNVCGYEWKVKPNSFLSKSSRCPKCAGNKKKTHEEFVKEIYDLVGDEYTVLGEYVNSDTKIFMRHNTCGYEYEVTPNGFLNGIRCRECSINGIRHKTIEEINDIFKKKIYDLVGDEYTVLGEYISNHTKILMRHNTCGHEWKVKPNSFLTGSRCPKCAVNRDFHSVNAELFKKRVYDLVGDEYTVLGEYVSSDTKILMRHNVCGHEWEVKPSNFTLYYNSIMNGEKERLGRRCPKCSHKNAKNRYLNIIQQEKENKNE